MFFDLGGFAQKLRTFALHGVEPRTGMAVVYPGALHVAGTGVFNELAAGGGAAIPDGIYVIVVGQHADQRVACAGDEVDHAARQVGGVEHPGRDQSR